MLSFAHSLLFRILSDIMSVELWRDIFHYVQKVSNVLFWVFVLFTFFYIFWGVLVLPGNIRERLVDSSWATNLASQPPRHADYDWVDPCVIEHITLFRGSSFVHEFISRVTMLKPDSPSNVVTVDSCSPSENVCHSQEGAYQDFIYVYTCLFTRLHITLSFDEFIMGVLRILNVTSIQLHPNSCVAL